MKRKLVTYFSAGGVTAKAAEMLAEAAGAELYEIRPEIPYTKDDLDWRNKKSRSTLEMKDKSYRPAIADNNADIASYDVIFVGFPIWWYVAPTIINTFLENYDFAGKTVVLFATSGGSGFGNTVNELKHSVAPSTVMIEGKILNGEQSKEKLQAWIQILGLE